MRLIGSLIGASIILCGASPAGAKLGSSPGNLAMTRKLRGQGWKLAGAVQKGAFDSYDGAWSNEHVAALKDGSRVQFSPRLDGAMSFTRSQTPILGRAHLQGLPTTRDVVTTIRGRFTWADWDQVKAAGGRIVDQTGVSTTVAVPERITHGQDYAYRHGVAVSAAEPSVVSIKLREHEVAHERVIGGSEYGSRGERDPDRTLHVKTWVADKSFTARMPGPVRFARIVLSREGAPFLQTVYEKANGALVGDVRPVSPERESVGAPIAKPIRVRSAVFDEVMPR